MLYGFDDDDGVVDDETDRQHQAEQRQRIDREAEQRKDQEGADQRDRHGEQWNERRAESLQEDEHDDDDEDQRFEQRLDDLLDALGHRQRRVERDDVVEVGRKLLLRVFHQRARLAHGV